MFGREQRCNYSVTNNTIISQYVVHISAILDALEYLCNGRFFCLSTNVIWKKQTNKKNNIVFNSQNR